LHSRVAHGASFIRAYHAPTSVQLGKAVTTSAKMAAVKATEASLKSQIAMLTDQLKQVEQVATLRRSGKNVQQAPSIVG